MPQLQHLLLGVLGRGDVPGDAAHQDRLVSRVTLDAAAGRDPAHPAIRQDQAVLQLVSASTASRHGHRVSLPKCVAVVGVQALQDAIEVQPLRRGEAKHLTPLVARPDLVVPQVCDPDAEVGSIDGQAQALFALAQPGLARLQLAHGVRRAKQVPAQLVAHHHGQRQVERTIDNRHLDVCPIHEHGLTHAGQKQELEASADHQRLPSVTPPPGGDAGIRDEDEKQQDTHLAEQHPGIAHAFRDRDGLSEKGNLTKTGDLQIVEILSGQEVGQQREPTQAADRPGESRPPGAQVEAHEPDNRRDPEEHHHVPPPHRPAEFLRRLSPHHPQLEQRERCGRHGRHGKEEIGPRPAVPEPDEDMNPCQREAR